MRVQCPHCNKDVTLPNDKAEQATACPICGNVFTAPALMNAQPDESPPPTPPVRQYTPPIPPPAAAPVPPPPVAPVTPPDSSAWEPCCRLTISKRIVHWIGPIALVLLFVLSFFTWVAAAPGGYPVYTQSAWGVLGGGFSADITGEKVLGREADLKGHVGFSFLMFIALIVLIPMVLIGLGELLEKYHKVPVPDAISHLWPKRLPILAGASLLIFVLLSMQLIFGLGLESATTVMAENRYAAPNETETSEQKMLRDLKRAEEVSRLGVRRTGWLWLAYLASAAAAVGFALELALEHRGDRSDPAIEFKW